MIVNRATAAELGLTTPLDLADTITTSTIVLDGSSTYANQISVMMTVVWGTSTAMQVTAEVSYDGSTWYQVTRCSEAATHDCGQRVWEFEVADGTAHALDFSTGYRYIRFTFDDSADGTGTITAEATMSKG